MFLCATPIGNLEDITLRALRVLREVDVIAAEDTRHTRKLLTHYQIHTPLTSYHQHNEAEKGDYILDLLRQGKQVALVSDAGMPGVSDPGYDLVVRAIAGGIRVVPVPGASAVTTALVVSGLPTRSFSFEGFLPRGKRERQRLLEELRYEHRTMVFYEAPHRLLATLEAMKDAWGPRPMAVVREATKVHEEVLRGDPGSLCEHFRVIPPRGEITLVVQGAGGGETDAEVKPQPEPQDLLREIRLLTQAGVNHKEAIKRVAKRFDLPKREVYAAVVEEKREETHSASSP